jgi:hypothetical protein
MNCSPYLFWTSLAQRIQQMIKGWVKPTTVALALGAIADIRRSRADLLIENGLLRQQLIVLHRQIKRPQLTNGDRIRLVLLARCTKSWLCWLLCSSGLFLAQNIDQTTRQNLLKIKGEI